MANRIYEGDHDSYNSSINNIPVGVHFYFLDNKMFGPLDINLAPVTQSGQVLSFIYTPFLTRRDLDLLRIPYNQGLYGSVDPEQPDPAKNPKECYVFKVRDGAINTSPKKLGSIKSYTNDLYPRAKGFRWYNESKLFQYPYQFPVITDYINTPLVIQPHLVDQRPNMIDIMVKQNISFNGSYVLYAKGYKGDTSGIMEGIISSNSLELPTGSSAYSQFMANSKSQFLASNMIASRNESLARYTTNKNAQLGYATSNMQYNAQLEAGRIGAMGTLLGGMGGGLFGILGAGVGSGLSLRANQVQASTSKNISDMQTQLTQQLGNLQNSVNKKNRIDQAMGFISDITSAPRNMSLTGGDMLQSISNSNKSVDVLRYGILDVYKYKIAIYFTMYGYKQNKFVNLSNASIKSRKYWNYIKTIGANIEGKTIPKDISDQIASIFDSGITFWHYENMQSVTGVQDLKMYEYTTLDNAEVNVPGPGNLP